MSKTIVVKTESGDVTVRKLAILDYADVLRALKSLPQEIGDLVTGTDSKKLKDAKFLFGALPNLTADAFPELLQIISIPTDKDYDFMTQLDLADTVDILVAAFQLNDYSRIVGAVKKMTAPAKPVVTTEAPSTE